MAEKSYRALTGLDYPTNAAAYKRRVAGENVPDSAMGYKRAEAGDVLTDLLPGSVKAYLADDPPAIEEVSG